MDINQFTIWSWHMNKLYLKLCVCFFKKLKCEGLVQYSSIIVIAAGTYIEQGLITLSPKG